MSLLKQADKIVAFRSYIKNLKLGFSVHGDRMFLKQDMEIEMIKAINCILDKKVPYMRRNYIKAIKACRHQIRIHQTNIIPRKK